MLGILYVQGPPQTGQLVYAPFDHYTGQWTTDPTPATGPVGGMALALEDDGTPHISFNESAAFGSWGALRYLTKSDGAWIDVTIDATHQYGYLTAIAVDEDGACHVLAKEEQDGALWYWTNVGGIWEGSILDSDSNPGRYSSIAIAPDGAPAAAYSTWSPKSEARYATLVGGDWSITPLSTSDTYRVVDLVVDWTGTPHVTYHFGDTLLYYATLGKNGWETELASAEGGKYASLGVAPDGIVHVVFSALADSQVLHLKRNLQGNWSTDYTGYYGLASGPMGVVVDGFGRPCIAFDPPDDGLKAITK